MPEKKVTTRFAPSPTGFLHLGNYRTAIFCYLFAQKHKGQFLLRIEDTDRARSKTEFEQNIVESLNWLKLPYQQPFYRQSERSEIYKKYIQQLIDSGHAYISKEDAKEEGQRTEVIRFKNPNKSVTFYDEIRKDITSDTTELGDFIIAKNIEEPTFHLAVVVDDFELGITHIIRGEDHISNTTRHVLIQQAIGAPTPHYAHVPLVLSPDRSKLSKRKGAKPLTYYRDQGFLPEAILNYLVLIGWNPGTEQEIFSVEELITLFDLSKVQKAGAIFDEEKLKWYNKQYILKLPKEELYARIKEIFGEQISGELLHKITPMIVERIQTFGDLKLMKEQGELDYVFHEPHYEKESLLFKGKGEFSAIKTHLEKVISLLEPINESELEFTAEKVKSTIWDYASEVGRGDVLWPMRFALSGKEKSPDPFMLSSLLGKKVTIERLRNAISKIS